MKIIAKFCWHLYEWSAESSLLTSLSKWYLHSLICAAACSVWLSRADRNLCHCGSMYLKYNSITTIKKYIEGWGGRMATKCNYFFLLLHTEITIKVIIDLQCPCLTLTRNTGGGHNWHLAKKSTSLHPHHSLCSDSDWGQALLSINSYLPLNPIIQKMSVTEKVKYRHKEIIYLFI